jgi:hypothetical protein
MQGFHASKFTQFDVQVFKKTQEILLRLVFIDGSFSRSRLFKLCDSDRMAIEMLDEQRRRKGGLVVETTATIRMAAGANLEVKGTVNLVLFGSVDAGQVFCHDGSRSLCIQ